MLFRAIKKLVPAPLFSLYHLALALVSALIYRFPSRTLFVIGITGTKGKSSTAELVNAILEEAGHTTALMSTIRFKVGDETRPNLFKMTMPGRFFLQKFLRQAARAGCTHAIVEMTSEGVMQSRHRFISLDALILTNITPEHIEAHGSYENYVAAKLELRDLLESSSKHPTWMVVNRDSKHADEFLEVHTATPVPHTLSQAEPYHTRDNGIDLTFDGVYMHSPLLGLPNLYNILSALTFAKTQKISVDIAKRAIEKLHLIPGRGEKIKAGQNFDVVIDYAHTIESLESLYQTFANKRCICVLGNTGGGRDRWKRPKMGALAEKYCAEIILTNEDPYNEDPRAIVDAVAEGMLKKKPVIVMDRRKAIRKALTLAKGGDVVLISGKGTDPYIMGSGGSKTPWSDAEVAREELGKFLGRKERA